jgi:diacylglycerol kinase (ATP)
MKFRFIVNPASGKLRKDTTLDARIQSLSVKLGLCHEIVYTQAPKHATELASEAAKSSIDVVVAVGGDGTMNEVAQGLLHTESVMGLIPCGSGNGLGRHLGISGSFDRAMHILKEGRVRLIDTGSVSGIPFFNVMGVGFDAEISQRFNPLPSRGLSAYVKVGFKAFIDYKPERYRVATEGNHAFESDAWMISVANSAQFGNNAYIAPNAEVDDGKLDLTCINLKRRVSVLPLTYRLFAKNIQRSKHSIMLQGESFTIERANSGIIHTDSEVHELGRVLRIQTHPKSLNILVPKEHYI